MRRLLRLAMAAVPLLAGWLMAGCAGSQSYEMQWKTYQVHRDSLADERDKLAQAVREVLVHRRFFPERDEHLSTPGKEGKLETGWNDDEARVAQASLQGHRYKVKVILKEGLEHLELREPDDPIERRMWESMRRDDGQTVALTVGIGCIREVNTRMNWMQGDYERAEWAANGNDPQTVARIHAEIMRHFSSIAERPLRDEGRDGSERTETLISGRDRLGEEDDDPANSLGPEDEGPGYERLGFGTDAN